MEEELTGVLPDISRGMDVVGGRGMEEELPGVLPDISRGLDGVVS